MAAQNGDGGDKQQPDAGRRSDRRMTRHAQKRKWYRNPFILAGIAVVVIAAGAGTVLAVRANSSSDSASGGSGDGELATTVGLAQTTADAPADTPLTSTEQAVANMTLEQKIGQMMMIGFDGQQPDATMTDMIQKKQIGGVIIYGRNIGDGAQVTQMDAAMQQLAIEAGQPAKLMIATDQEGGSTRRFDSIGPNYSEPMIGEMNGGAGASSALTLASSAARDLKQLGINTNLAPVADVSSGWSSVMDGRSYGTDSQVDAELTASAINGYNRATTISAVKHFPGLGSAEDDPETTAPVIDKSAADWQSTDLVPFGEAIKADAPMIMVAHLKAPALDPSGAIASMSKPIITDLLRGQMGFKGVVITDDMEMGAVDVPAGQAAVAAVAAGADIVMFGQTNANQLEAYNALIDAVKSGKLKESDIDKSVVRILDMKKRFRLELPSDAPGQSLWEEGASSAGGDDASTTGDDSSSQTGSPSDGAPTGDGSTQ